MAREYDQGIDDLFRDHEFEQVTEDGPLREDMPVGEETDPTEMSRPADEYNLGGAVSGLEDPERKRSAKEHKKHKKYFLRPVAATIAATSVVLASYGADPLGDDFLGSVEAEEEVQVVEAPVEVIVEEPAEILPEVLPEEPEVTYPEDVFPELDNLDPDFEGNYAWSGEGTEEYVRFYRENDDTGYYLVKGSAWDKYDAAGQLVTDDSGISYDRDSNTLTLTDFSGYYLDVNLMGNGFTIKLEGDNQLTHIDVWGALYGGSLTLEGDGSLTVSNGIYLHCEASRSCMIVKQGVTLEVYGDGAVSMETTLMEDAFYMSNASEMVDGRIEIVGSGEQSGLKYYHLGTVDENGNMYNHLLIRPKE